MHAYTHERRGCLVAGTGFHATPEAVTRYWDKAACAVAVSACISWKGLGMKALICLHMLLCWERTPPKRHMPPLMLAEQGRRYPKVLLIVLSLQVREVDARS